LLRLPLQLPGGLALHSVQVSSLLHPRRGSRTDPASAREGRPADGAQEFRPGRRWELRMKRHRAQVRHSVSKSSLLVRGKAWLASTAEAPVWN
jgi:hypothetical protein